MTVYSRLLESAGTVCFHSGHCAGTVRALCGHCARAWNAVLSVQAGPSETCSLPFPARSMGFSLYEASRQSHRHMHRMLSFVMGSRTKKAHAYVGCECSQVGPGDSRMAEKVAGSVCAAWCGCLR